MQFLKNITREYKTTARGWLIFSVVAALLFLLPLVFIFFSASGQTSEQWDVVLGILMPEYISNTLFLLAGTLGLTFLIGVSTAWVVSNYSFPFRKFFRVGLLLPLALPTYILAYIVGGVFDSTGSLRAILQATGLAQIESGWQLHIFSPWILMTILSLALFPYVYASTLASFSMQSVNYLETARSFGKKPLAVFLKVGLPLSRPAIFAGMLLVAMEVLNEYGAVKYFNFKTLTSGIFTAWQLGDITAASRIAFVLLFIVASLFWIEKKARGRSAYTNVSRSRPVELVKLKGLKQWGAFFLCFLPFFLGFLVPFAQLIYWTSSQLNTLDVQFFIISWNSLFVALGVAMLVVLLGLLLNYAFFYNKGTLSGWGRRMGSVGYALPGAVVAIGVVVFFTYLDRTIGEVLFSAGFAGLFLAYVIRFFAVASNPIEGNMLKVGASRIEASQNLGKKSWITLIKVQFPIVKPVLGAALILVTIDVLKELPLTLILRPLSFNTLATRTYDLAQTYEAADMAAPYALFIVLLSIIPLLFVNRLFSR